MNSEWDAAGNVSSCNNISDAPRNIPYPLVVAMPSDPEPMASRWAQPNNFIRLPDTLHETDAIGRCPAAGYQSSPQAGLEAAIRQPPESWLINTVAALTRACLAGRAASEEFRPQLPNHPPDKSSMVEQQCPSDIVNRTDRMSNRYSPALQFNNRTQDLARSLTGGFCL
jgi:hypothetical protein